MYAVRAPTLHPIEENQRAERFRSLLRTPINEQSLHEMGQLMSAAHDSYSACGLGSDATDLLVNLVAKPAPAAGLYGAKITGGGSGGTVAILGRSGARRRRRRHRPPLHRTHRPRNYVFRGSSPGCV